MPGLGPAMARASAAPPISFQAAGGEEGVGRASPLAALARQTTGTVSGKLSPGLRFRAALSPFRAGVDNRYPTPNRSLSRAAASRRTVNSFTKHSLSSAGCGRLFSGAAPRPTRPIAPLHSLSGTGGATQQVTLALPSLSRTRKRLPPRGDAPRRPPRQKAKSCSQQC
jgi:hypothetical protein